MFVASVDFRPLQGSQQTSSSRSIHQRQFYFKKSSFPLLSDELEEHAVD